MEKRGKIRLVAAMQNERVGLYAFELPRYAVLFNPSNEEWFKLSTDDFKGLLIELLDSDFKVFELALPNLKDMI